MQQATAANLPPTASVDPNDSVRQLWMSRIYQCVLDEYMGAPLCKFPEDLRVYEHLLSATATQVVVELGAYGGGSSLWFRDRLQTLATYGRVTQPLVVTVDIDLAESTVRLDAADPDWRASIHLLEGDVRDPATARRVADLVPDGASTLVIDDSAHTYETTFAALTHFSRFVQPGGYFVVEDGSVDVEILRLYDEWPRGVLPAMDAWLLTEQGRGFRVRRDLELYGLTTNPQGYLQRVA